MARKQIVTETEEARNQRIFAEVYAELETEIRNKHVIKQQAPIVIQLKPYFEENQIAALFLYDTDAKTDLKMLVPKTYTEETWQALMQQLIALGEFSEALPMPTEPVAFAKFVKVVEINPVNILNSKYEYYVNFYTQEELNKITSTIENFEIVNYTKKASYQNALLKLKDTQDIAALRNLQKLIKY